MTIRKKILQPKARRSWLIILLIELFCLPILGLVLVWGGIERTDTTYFINIAQNEVRERQAWHAKLEVEKERLLSPYELRKKAENFGLHEPLQGQIRRMELE